MRVRIVVVAIASILLLLGGALLLVGAVRQHDASGIAFALVLMLGFPGLGVLGLWWGVRRYRRDADFRSRQLNAPATRAGVIGNMVVLFVAIVAQNVVGRGLLGWAVLLVICMSGSYAVYRIRNNLDPRATWWGRPDPLPDGQEPEKSAPRQPW